MKGIHFLLEKETFGCYEFFFHLLLAGGRGALPLSFPFSKFHETNGFIFHYASPLLIFSPPVPPFLSSESGVSSAGVGVLEELFYCRDILFLKLASSGAEKGKERWRLSCYLHYGSNQNFPLVLWAFILSWRRKVFSSGRVRTMISSCWD